MLSFFYSESFLAPQFTQNKCPHPYLKWSRFMLRLLADSFNYSSACLPCCLWTHQVSAGHSLLPFQTHFLGSLYDSSLTSFKSFLKYLLIETFLKTLIKIAAALTLPLLLILNFSLHSLPPPGHHV